MHARDVGFTPDLVSYLDGLAGRAHNLLYAAPPYRLGAAWDLVAREFPRTLRRNGRTMHFILMRASPKEALEASAPRGAQLLAPGQSLHWTTLAPESCFVIPLPLD